MVSEQEFIWVGGKSPWSANGCQVAKTNICVPFPHTFNFFYDEMPAKSVATIVFSLQLKIP